jgi:hypothetical protein
MKVYFVPLLAHVLTSLFSAAIVVAIALFAYDHMVARPAQLVGVVDVGEVYRLKEAEFTQLVTRTTSEDERQKALLLARQFAQRLPTALEELPRDCHCLVVVRSALAGSPPHAVDLTALLKHKVDLP